MKKIFLILIVGLQSCLIRAQTHNTPFLQKSLVGQGIQQVDLETRGGNISIAGGEDAEARLEVYVWGNNRDDLSKEEIQKRLDEDYTLNISVSDHKLVAIAKQKFGSVSWRRGLNISFKVIVPVGCSSTLRTSGGNIDIHNLTGDMQDFKTSGGNLEIGGLSGKVIGRTSGGNIVVDDCKNGVNLETSGGNIEAGHCHGDIRLVTSGGNLDLKMLQGEIVATTSGGNVNGEAIEGVLTAHTSGGNIDLKGLSCSLETSTSGGWISVNMKELGKYLTIDNSSGDIDLQLPAGKGMDLKIYGSRISSTGLSNFNGKTDEKHIDGTVNGGGVAVKVEGGSGKVKLDVR